MKKTFTLLLSGFFLFLTGAIYAQINSVDLKDGLGNPISSHSSITDAYAAIPATISQAYIIELTNAYNGSTETYPITFINKVGASQANIITLRPALGVISMSVQTNLAGNPVLRLDDADYVIIDGRAGGTGTVSVLTFNNLSTAANANTIQMINGSCFNTVRYCTILNSTTSGTGRNVHLSTSANPSGNSDNTFKYCDIIGGRYQFNSSGTALSPNTRNTIFGCNFRDGTFAMFWGQANTGKTLIDSCSFSCTAPTGSGLFFGILFDSQNDSAIIVNNKMYDIQDLTVGTLRYVHIRSIVAGGNSFVDIHNNFFSMMTGNSALTNIGAIEISSGASQAMARIAHNSIRFGGTLASGGTAGNVGSSGLLISSTNVSSNFDIRNNLFVNERTGGTTGLQHLAMALTTSTNSIFNLAGNTYNSISGDLTRWGTTVNTNIAAHQAVVSGGEPTANDFAVQFVSANDLHITCAIASSPSITASQIPGINTDIDGNIRGTTTCRGADEANSVTSTINGLSNVTCNGLSNGSVTVNANGGVLPYTYTWSPSGGNAANATGLAAGNYTVTINDAGGCTITSTVAITQPVAINVGTTLNGAIITANAAGATYQWLDCSNNSPISGQTGQTFTATSNGSYKVIVTIGVCSDTSACVAIATVGMEEQSFFEGMQLYPNPGAGLYTLVINQEADLTVSNLMGQVVLKQTLNKGNNSLSLDKFTNGIYYINIVANGKSSAVKLIKQ